MLMKKVWDHAIDLKEEFISRKEEIYLLSWEVREELKDFI